MAHKPQDVKKVEEDLFALRSDFEAEATNLQRQISAAKYSIDKLNRKSRGITLANRNTARIEKSLNKLEKKLSQLEADAKSYGVSSVIVKDLRSIETTVLNQHLAIDQLIAKVTVLESNDQIDTDNTGIETIGSAELKVITPWLWALAFAIVAGVGSFILIDMKSNWASGKIFLASLIISAASFFIAASFQDYKILLKLQSRILWAFKKSHKQTQATASATSTTAQATAVKQTVR